MAKFTHLSPAETLKKSSQKAITPVWTIIMAQNEEGILPSPTQRFYIDGGFKYLGGPFGIRSFLQHTYEVACRISTSQRILIVLTNNQERWAMNQFPEVSSRHFLILPDYLGTGPATLFAIAHILSKEPTASILLSPMNHLICPETDYVENLERVFPALDVMTGMSAALLGIRPMKPREGMNWILPGKSVGNGNLPGFFKVQQFIENPLPKIAPMLFECGAFFNTFILAGKARRLWHLLSKRMPETSSLIAHCQRLFKGEGIRRWPEKTLDQAVPFSLFSGVLAREKAELLVMPLQEAARTGPVNYQA
jgi:mannose-1-phosphate guanylyltransferase